VVGLRVLLCLGVCVFFIYTNKMFCTCDLLFHVGLHTCVLSAPYRRKTGMGGPKGTLLWIVCIAVAIDWTPHMSE
jgi:hypothetical protein